MLPPRIAVLDHQTTAQHRCCTTPMCLGLHSLKKNMLKKKKKKKNWNFKTLLMVLIGSPNLLTHGMRQTGFCSQARNIGSFGQDLLKLVFITCSASFCSTLRLRGFYLFVILHLSTLGPSCMFIKEISQLVCGVCQYFCSLHFMYR